MPPRGRIVIVGGGIAGLSLARVLNARTIPNIVLERQSRSRKTAFGINLRQWAWQPLCQRLRLDYSSIRAASTVKLPAGESGRIGSPMMDAKSGDPMTMEPSGFRLTMPEEGYFRYHSKLLSGLLRDGVNIAFECNARRYLSSGSDAIVECINSFTGKTLDSVRGTMVVGAGGMFSNVRLKLGILYPLMQIPAIVFQVLKFMSRPKVETEVGPYMNESSVIIGCIQAWRMCISVDSMDKEVVVLCTTYSRPCVDEKDLALVYPHEPQRPSRPLDKIPESIKAELRQLSPLAPPFGVTHNVEDLQDDNNPYVGTESVSYKERSIQGKNG